VGTYNIQQWVHISYTTVGTYNIEHTTTWQHFSHADAG